MPFLRRNSPFTVPTLLIGGADGVNGAGWKNTIIANSAIVRKGDVLSVAETITAGNIVPVRRYNAVDESIVGICVGFGRANGQAVDFDADTNDTVTVGSGNQTAAQIYAIIDITPGAVWSAPLDGTIHTTQTAGFGTFFDPDTGANAGRIAETTAIRTHADSGGRGLACVGVDPEDTTRALVTVVESVFQGFHNDA